MIMTEPEVIRALVALVRERKPKRLVELGSGPSTTPMFAGLAVEMEFEFISVDTSSSFATVHQDAAAWMRENPDSVDFLFSDAGGWDTRIACAELAPPTLRDGGVACFHDVQEHGPLYPVLKEMGAVFVEPPRLNNGNHGGLAVWEKTT